MVNIDALGTWALGMIDRELSSYRERGCTANVNLRHCVSCMQGSEEYILEAIGFWSDERVGARARIRLLTRAREQLLGLVRSAT